MNGNLNNALNAVNGDISSLKEAAYSPTAGGYNSFAQYSADVLGINAAALGNVPSTIQSYVQKVDEVIQGIEKASGEIKYDTALKGSTQTAALEGYISSAVETIKTVTDTINKFGEAIGTVQQNYLNEESTVAGNMGAVSQQEVTAKTGVSGFDG